MEKVCTETTPTLLYVDLDNDDMYDIGEDIISVADVEAEVSADDCCRHFQDDGRYKHLACRPHEHNARSTFAYVPVAPFGNLQC